MRRREKFLISSFFLSLGLLVVQLVPLEYKFLASLIFCAFTYGVSIFALFEDLQPLEAVTIVPFPALYAFAVSQFYFLLPEGLLSKILLLGLFGVGMYAMFLTCNIYSVAKARTIQLLRAAHAVGLFMTLFITFLLSNSLFSYSWPYWANGVILLVLLFPLGLTSLWSMELSPALTREVVFQAGIVAWMGCVLGVVLSFYPGSVWSNSLFVVTGVYASLGILTARIEGRLFQNTIFEYVGVFIAMTILYLGLLSWQ